jgi:hypothetical protein
MENETDQRYLEIVNRVGVHAYKFYRLSDRKDLVMVYEMKEDKIYSFVYDEYLDDLNPKSQEMLKIQYKEARESGKIVLFIRDEEMRKIKSYVI